MRSAPAAAAGSLLALVFLLGCADPPATAPRPRAPSPLGALVAHVPDPAEDSGATPAAATDAAATAARRVARVEIVPASLPLVYDSATQLVERDFTAVAYDSAGHVLADRVATWSDATNWNPALALRSLSPTAVRVALPYANAAAPARTPSGECPLAWKGIRATIDGVSALAPVCGTFTVAVAAERREGFVPVSGDTFVVGAGQRCRVTAIASGGHGGYDYSWFLDGAPVGFGPTLTLDTGPVARRALVLRASDEGHDIAPWREMRFVLVVEEGREELDC